VAVSYTPFYYRHSLALLTDFYELNMAYAHWKAGTLDLPSVFTLSFRSNPFGSGYSIAAGLQSAVELVENIKFEKEDLEFLSTLFEKDFLKKLGESPFRCDLHGVTEGTVVFPFEPILRVEGPMWQCQLLESALLNIINFQSLIATKASRVIYAARNGRVVEFGLRRAQGFDGAISASRAAYIVGVHATSNVLASKLFGIPLAGTHAHSWVMAFETELEAFRKYAAAFPDKSILLVDTYDTAMGIKNAIIIGMELKKQGKKLAGIRLDSGDFAFLSEEARKQLDAAGLKDTKIVASNELDEHLIQSLQIQGAKIDTWGVGTKLITAQDQPAMSGVYKLSAVYENGHWKNRIKVSNQPIKTSTPGRHRLRRYFNTEGLAEADLIYDESESGGITEILDPVMTTRTKKIQSDWTHKELLRPILVGGKRVVPLPAIEAIRSHCSQDLTTLHPGHRRFENPHEYRVGLSPYLAKLKNDLIRSASGH
jgi:nicotinate phosphoribosyltransferase